MTTFDLDKSEATAKKEDARKCKLATDRTCIRTTDSTMCCEKGVALNSPENNSKDSKEVWWEGESKAMSPTVRNLIKYISKSNTDDSSADIEVNDKENTNTTRAGNLLPKRIRRSRVSFADEELLKPE